MLILIVMVATGSFLFIRFSNDHKECEDVISKSTDSDGNTIVTTEHICKEKYSF